MKALAESQENESLQEGGPPLWWCRLFCNACNGHPESHFWCGSHFHQEQCDWTEEQQDEEVDRRKENKDLGKKKSEGETKEKVNGQSSKKNEKRGKLI